MTMIDRAIASAIAALLGLGAGVGARRVDEGDDRHPEALGQLHEPHRLAVALGLAPSRSCAGCSRRCRRPSGGRRSRPAGRRSGRGRPRSRRRRRRGGRRAAPRSASAIPAISSRAWGRRALRASWTRAQTASRGLGGLLDGRRSSPGGVASRALSCVHADGQPRTHAPLDASSRGGRGRREHVEERGQLVAQLGARGDPVHEAVAKRNSARWKPGGSSSAIVPAETRAPAKPISAFGSAMLTSPRAANEAKTPPVVGSARTEMNGTPAARSARAPRSS